MLITSKDVHKHAHRRTFSVLRPGGGELLSAVEGFAPPNADDGGGKTSFMGRPEFIARTDTTPPASAMAASCRSTRRRRRRRRRRCRRRHRRRRPGAGGSRRRRRRAADADRLDVPLRLRGGEGPSNRRHPAVGHRPLRRRRRAVPSAARHDVRVGGQADGGGADRRRPRQQVVRFQLCHTGRAVVTLGSRACRWSVPVPRPTTKSRATRRSGSSRSSTPTAFTVLSTQSGVAPPEGRFYYGDNWRKYGKWFRTRARAATTR